MNIHVAESGLWRCQTISQPGLMGVHKTSTQVLPSPNEVHRVLAVLIWPLSTNRSMRLSGKEQLQPVSGCVPVKVCKMHIPLRWFCLSYLICTHNTAQFLLPGSPVVAQKGGSDSALLDLEQGRYWSFPEGLLFFPSACHKRGFWPAVHHSVQWGVWGWECRI